jgi:hypothetical protein
VGVDAERALAGPAADPVRPLRSGSAARAAVGLGAAGLLLRKPTAAKQ